MSTPTALWLANADPAWTWGATANAKDPGELDQALRDRYWTLRLEAHRLGLRLEVASGYRTPWQQYLLRVGRVPAGHEFDGAYGGHPPTALPGRSHHQQRAAVDVDMTGAGYDWLAGVCGRYGLALTVPGERWHLEAVGSPTVALTAYPGPTYDQPQEGPDVPLTDADINRVALVAAATTDKVMAHRFAELQQALGLPVIAGVDKVLSDNFAELRELVDQVLAAEAAEHGPA